MNILVVEDNKPVQDMLFSVLSAQGYNVDIANNGLDALSKIQDCDYQLLVIDHLMPLMNGIQLTKNLRNNPRTNKIKILFMTTQGIQTVKKLPEFVLFNEVIDKPINQEHFLSTLSTLIESSNESDSISVQA